MAPIVPLRTGPTSVARPAAIHLDPLFVVTCRLPAITSCHHGLISAHRSFADRGPLIARGLDDGSLPTSVSAGQVPVDALGQRRSSVAFRLSVVGAVRLGRRPSALVDHS